VEEFPVIKYIYGVCYKSCRQLRIKRHQNNANKSLVIDKMKQLEA